MLCNLPHFFLNFCHVFPPAYCIIKYLLVRDDFPSAGLNFVTNFFLNTASDIYIQAWLCPNTLCVGEECNRILFVYVLSIILILHLL